MRRSEHYTAAPDSIHTHGPEVYREAFTGMSLFSKLLVLVQAWLKGESLELMVRERELRNLYRYLERDHHEVVDPVVPMLLNGFARPVRDLAKRLSVVKTVVDEATGERAGDFLQTALERVDPEVAEQLSNAARVPEYMLDDYTVSVAGVNATVKEQILDALAIHRNRILRGLGPVWNALAGLKSLSEIPYKNLLPSGGTQDARIPVRVVREDLIALYRELQYCNTHPETRGLDVAAEFATHRLGRSFSFYRGIWEQIEELLEQIPFLDIIRIALDEPRASVDEVKHTSDWWTTLERSWTESPEAGPTILRHRSFRIESILHDDFSVAAPAITWIPVSLYQRTVGALRRLASGAEFRLTRVFVGTLAREDGILRLTSKKDLLDAHVQLDQELDKLEDLIGSGDNRGKIGEEVKRLNAGSADASIVRIQMTGVLAKYRPVVRVMIDGAITALETIHRVCASEEKGITRGFPRLSNALADTMGETSPRYVLDLIIHRYGPLVETLRGLAAIERELSVGAETETEELMEAVE